MLGVWMAPVTAQLMMTLAMDAFSPAAELGGSLHRGRGGSQGR